MENRFRASQFRIKILNQVREICREDANELEKFVTPIDSSSSSNSFSRCPIASKMVYEPEIDCAIVCPVDVEAADTNDSKKNLLDKTGDKSMEDQIEPLFSYRKTAKKFGLHKPQHNSKPAVIIREKSDRPWGTPRILKPYYEYISQYYNWDDYEWDSYAEDETTDLVCQDDMSKKKDEIVQEISLASEFDRLSLEEAPEVPQHELIFSSFTRAESDRELVIFYQVDYQGVSLFHKLLSLERKMEMRVKSGKKLNLTGKHPVETPDGITSDMYRTIIACGRYIGIADSKSELISREMASLDILSQLAEEKNPQANFSLNYQLLFDYTSLFRMLQSLKRGHALQYHVWESRDNLYKCTIRFGPLETKGESSIRLFAVGEACKNMHLLICGFPFDRVFFAAGDLVDVSKRYKWIYDHVYQ